MIRRMRKWFKDQNNITRKTAGLEEKAASVQRKFDVALSILNRREKEIEVPFERRKIHPENLEYGQT